MDRPSTRSLFVVLGVVVGGFAVWSRFLPLDTSLWLDEAYTARYYVVPGPSSIFNPADYLPNNHVLFSLLAWATAKVAGTSEIVIRLWSVVPALAAIGLVAEWCRREFGRVAALVVASLLIVSPLHLGLSVQARGYGLGFLAAAAMLVLAVRIDRRPSAKVWALLAVAGFAAIATLPQMAFVYGGHLLVLVRRRTLRAAVVVNGLVVGVGSGLFYRALISNIVGQTQRVGSRAGDTVGPWDIIDDPAQLLYRPWTTALTQIEGVRDRLAPWVISASFLALVMLGAWAIRRRGNADVLAHLLMPWLTVMLALMVLGSSTLDRYISFLIVPLAVLIGIGLSDGLCFAISPRPLRLALGLSGLALLLAGLVRWTAVWDEPFENYADAVDLAHSYEIDRIATNRSPGSAGFRWYDSSIEVVQDVTVICESVEPMVLLDFPFGESMDTSCLDEIAISRTEVAQRRPPKAIVVWVVEGQ